MRNSGPIKASNGCSSVGKSSWTPRNSASITSRIALRFCYHLNSKSRFRLQSLTIIPHFSKISLIGELNPDYFKDSNGEAKSAAKRRRQSCRNASQSIAVQHIVFYLSSERFFGAASSFLGDFQSTIFQKPMTERGVGAGEAGWHPSSSSRRPRSWIKLRKWNSEDFELSFV